MELMLRYVWRLHSMHETNLNSLYILVEKGHKMMNGDWMQGEQNFLMKLSWRSNGLAWLFVSCKRVSTSMYI